MISVIEKLEKVKDFNEEELNRWQQNETLIEEKESEKEQVVDQHKTLEVERAEEKKKLEDYRNQLQISEKRKTDIDVQLRPLFKKYSDANENYARRSAGKNYFKVTIAIFLLLSVVAGAVITREPQFYVMIAAIAAGTIAFVLALFYYVRFVKPYGELKQLEQNIYNRAGELGLPGDTISQIQEQIKRFEETLQRQQQRVSTSAGRVAYLKDSCKSLREERLADIESRLTDARQQLRLIHARHGIEAISIYRQRLWQRREFEQNIKESMAALKSLFGMRGDTVTESIKYWQAEIQDMKEYKNVPVETEFNEKFLEKKKTKLREIQEEIDALQRRLREYRERLADLERRTRAVTLPEEDIFPCRTLSDLIRLKEHLLAFLQSIEKQQRSTRTTIEIFEEIEREEKQKVSVLFGEESNISRLYNDITDGLYPEVFYETDTASIKIRRRDGKFLPAAWLSSGAYDQLYFVIRMALSEKLLRTKKGFFILDDPFVKSDGERLKRQLDILLNFSQTGWQIIYFSAKDEVRALLQKHIERNLVNLQMVPGVDFKR